MRREDFGSYLTIDNRGERIRLFIPPKPPISSELSLSAEQRKILANTLFCLGRLDGTSSFSEVGQKLWDLTRIKEFGDSLALEGLESGVVEYLLEMNEPRDSMGERNPVGLRECLSEFDRCLSLFQSRRAENDDFWGLLTVNRVAIDNGEHSPPRYLARGGFGSTSVAPPKKEVEAGLESLTNHIFLNRLKLDPLDSVAIFFGIIWLLNPYGAFTGLVARSISLGLLRRDGLMNSSVINLSSAIRENEHRLSESLSLLKNTGDWEAWVAGFADLISEATRKTVAFNIEVGRLFYEDRVRASALGRASESIHRIIDVIFETPVFTSNSLVAKTALTAATVNKSLQHMMDLGIICETTSRKRNRIFQHEALMKLISGN